MYTQSNPHRNPRKDRHKNHYKRLRELIIFAMLGTIMFCSKIIMEVLPNIHLLGMLTVLYTVVFRVKALIPIYLYVIMNAVYAGFSPWYYPYLYVWTVLWGITMLLPRRLPRVAAMIVYPIICGLHGLAFGALYAPVQALIFGFDFEQTVAWIIAGLPFDIIHCASNVCTGLLIYPLSKMLDKLHRGDHVA